MLTSNVLELTFSRIVCYTVVLLLIPYPCLADDVESYFAKTPAELAAIPVTIATGTLKPNFHSAGSTTVITEEQIKAIGATELYEVIETVPGIHTSLQAVSQDHHYSVRGIANENNSQMLILLNGTRITTPFRGSIEFGPNLPLAAISRIEVIRGPGSAVYGADAFAGVVNIITKQGADHFGKELGVRAGNWNTQSGWGQYGNKHAGWDILANVQYQGTEGDSGRIIGQDYQSQFDRLLGTNASHAPGAMNSQFKAINTHVNAQRKYWKLSFWANNTLNSGTRAGAGGSLDPKGYADGAQYLGDIRYSTEDWFDNWEFLAHASYLNNSLNAKAYIFPANALLPVGQDGNVGSGFDHLILFKDGAIDNVDYTQQIPALEIGTTYKGWDNHLFRFGAGYRYEAMNIDKHLTNYGKGIINNNFPAVVNDRLQNVAGTSFAFLNNNHRSIWSFFLQDEWQITEDWSLTAGVRYDNYSDFGSTVNPRFALVWDINEQLSSKILYGKAFRAPSFAELGTQNNPIVQGNPNLSPETLHSAEWTFNYRPFSQLNTNLNFYYYHIDDLITSTIPKSGLMAKYDNTGQQDGYGTEFEWNWQIHEQWRLSGNYSWQNSRNKVTKTSVIGVPEHQVYVASIWHFLPKWQFQSQLNWVGGRYRDTGDRRPLNDYETIDFTVRGDKLWGILNIAASLRNAFDDNNFEPARLPGYPVNYPLPGRSFYLEASVNF